MKLSSTIFADFVSLAVSFVMQDDHSRHAFGNVEQVED